MHFSIFPLLVTAFLTQSCSTVYYNFWESLGKEKHDLLVANIEEVQDDQKDVEKAFSSALDRIRKEYSLKEPDLEEFYDDLSADYQRAQKKAEQLTARIDKVETIAQDLFAEWEDEADDIKTDRYRQDSLQKLKATKSKFKPMLASMRGVEKSMTPVLSKFNDQVLYLKHNLNAKALGAFKKEFVTVEAEIKALVADIEKSTARADEFMSQM